MTDTIPKHMPFLKKVALDIHARFGNDIGEVAIVFNNKRPIIYLKKYLSEIYGKTIWSPQFFTVQEFFRQSSRAIEMTPLSQVFLLHELHNALLAEEGRAAETLDEFFSIAETIVQDFAQIDYERVDPYELFRELYDITEIDIRFQHFTEEQKYFLKQFWASFSIQSHTAVQQRFLKLWKRLPRLYERFQQALREKNRTTMAGVYRKLAEGEADHSHFLRSYKHLVFVGFNALNACESTLFKAWQEEGMASFYFDADQYYVADPIQEAGYFIRKNIGNLGLRNALGDFPDLLRSKTDTIQLFSVSGDTSQAKWLAELLQQYEEEAQQGKTAAILLADESLIVPVLQSLPAHLPLNITTGFPFKQSGIYGLFELWIQVQSRYRQRSGLVFHKDLEAFATHPYSRLNVHEQDMIQGQLSDMRLTEFSVQDIRVDSSFYPSFFHEVADQQQLLDTLSALVTQLYPEDSQQEYLHRLDASLLLEVHKTINILRQGLREYADLPLNLVFDLVKKAFSGISATIEGEPLHGLQVMGLLESRCLDFDTIFLLGANEGVLPKTSASPTFIPPGIRKAYGLPLIENQQALSAYLFYRQLQYASEISILYNGTVSETNTGEKSRFIRQLEFESQFKIAEKSQYQLIATSAPPLVTVAKSGRVWDKMQHYFSGEGGKLSLSASAFTTYLQSPLQFFLKYIAKIPEPPRVAEEFEVNVLGEVIHLAMERAYEVWKVAGTPVAKEALQAQLKQVDSLCFGALQTVLGQQAIQSPADLNSLQRIMLQIAEDYVHIFLSHDAHLDGELRILELENTKDYYIDFPISVAGVVRNVRLYGVIDRVDEFTDAYGNKKKRIVDYKTGGDELKFANLERVFEGLDDTEPEHFKQTDNKALIQMLYYTLVYESFKGVRGVEPNLYVARKLRNEGSLFYSTKFKLEAQQLELVKENFREFLRQALEELFNADIPFRHNPDSPIYDSDPYTLFYGDRSWAEDE